MTRKHAPQPDALLDPNPRTSTSLRSLSRSLKRLFERQVSGPAVRAGDLPDAGRGEASETRIPRRRLLALSAVLPFGTLALGSTREADSPATAIQAQGESAGRNDGYGQPSAFARLRRAFFPQDERRLVSASFTPLQDLEGTITPSGLHYEVHHGGIPDIDPETYRLLVHGRVDRPLSFSLQDLRRFPSVTRIAFLECAGNTMREWASPTMPTVQLSHGLTSNSEWTGVPLSTVLEEAGLQPGAEWILAEGQDAGRLSRSIPIQRVLDRAMLVWAQNGEPLRPEQGYPLRLLLPGMEGNMSIKWLHRLEVGDSPFYTKPEVSTYIDPMPDGSARILTMEMDAKSVITYPAAGSTLTARGYVQIRGLSWSGRGRIESVDISVDGGRSWAPARLENPVLPMAHTRFTFDWHWSGQPTVIMSRARDETGYVQPTRTALVEVRGTTSRNHYNAIQGWAIDDKGQVSNVHA